MNLGEKNQGTVPNKCAKFQNVLPYGSRGCHRYASQKTTLMMMMMMMRLNKKKR